MQLSGQRVVLFASSVHVHFNSFLAHTILQIALLIDTDPLGFYRLKILLGSALRKTQKGDGVFGSVPLFFPSDVDLLPPFPSLLPSLPPKNEDFFNSPPPSLRSPLSRSGRLSCSYLR